VGIPEARFDAQIKLLRDCSPFFDRLFKDRDVEPTPGPLRFANDDLVAFAEFLSWAYGEEICKDQPSPQFVLLFRLWILAEKFEAPQLRILVTMLCRRELKRSPNAVLELDSVKVAYNDTKPDSTLRQIAVEIWAQRATESQIVQDKDQFPRRFLEDLCCAFS
jgi:hypothetical protein